MSLTESEIRMLLASRSEAMQVKDIERLMPLYAPGVVYFDLVPPLRYAGSAALRARFLSWFGRWQSPIGQDVHELDVCVSGDVAAAHMLIRAYGTLKDGQQVDYWVRTSNSFRRFNRAWSITHEHVSLPVDLKTRRAVMELAP